MIILPDQRISRSKFLFPVFKSEWREPSLTLPRDEIGNSTTKTIFTVSAKSNDGVCLWIGVFECREDFDAFLWAIANGSLKNERALWDLPTPSWQPWMGELITYDFATTTFLTTAGSNQTYSVPADWNNSDNIIRCIGGGGSGAGQTGSSGSRAGGGGGAYTSVSNITISGSVTYRVGTGGSSVTSSISGNAGGQTWFNDTAYPTTGSNKCGADCGYGGNTSSGIGSGGANTTGYPATGSTRYSGGTSNTQSATASGGGGAAGPNGNGGSTSASKGGAGDNGSGGAGGNGGTPASNGSAGTEFSASYGCGGGGGGSFGTSSVTGGQGGLYGAGGGAAINTSSSIITTGAGRQGLIVVTYTPASINPSFNSPMLGM